ncbi:MAG: small multi-drug export protein [Candidatus Micrarchaeota archaeon]
MFEEELTAFLLGGAPVSEIRGAVLYALATGKQELILLGVIGNVVALIALLVLWDALKIELIGRRILGEKLNSRLKEAGEKTQKYGWLGLLFFIAIPFPATGVYTGVLIGKILGYKNRFIILAGLLGIACAGVITFLAATGAISFLNVLV